MTWKGGVTVLAAFFAAQQAVEWDNNRDMQDRIETRVSRDEFLQHVQAQNRWQDRMESGIEALRSAAIQPAGDVTQAQYMLVHLPPTVEELRDARVRDMLMLNGEK